MSERSEKSFFRNPVTKRVLGAVATCSIVFGAAEYGPEIIDSIAKIGTVPSEVVAGVLGYVDGHQSSHWWTGRFYAYKYWLDVEQCPQDVNAALNGNPDSESFVKQPYTLTEGCYIDAVKVSPDTYGSYTDGQVIEFSGAPGTHLLK